MLICEIIVSDDSNVEIYSDSNNETRYYLIDNVELLSETTVGELSEKYRRMEIKIKE